MAAAVDGLVSALRADVAARLLGWGEGSDKRTALLAGWAGGAALLRLRQRKGKEVGKVLADARTVRSSIARVSDGSEVRRGTRDPARRQGSAAGRGH